MIGRLVLVSSVVLMLGALKRGVDSVLGAAAATVAVAAIADDEVVHGVPETAIVGALSSSPSSSSSTYSCRCSDRAPRAVTCAHDHPLFPGRTYYACDVCRFFRWAPRFVVANNFSKMAYEELKSAHHLEKRPPLQLDDGGGSSGSSGSPGNGRYACRCPGGGRPLRREVCGPDHALFPGRAFHYCDTCRHFTWDPGYAPPERVRYSMLAYEALPEAESPRKQRQQLQLLDASPAEGGREAGPEQQRQQQQPPQRLLSLTESE